MIDFFCSVPHYAHHMRVFYDLLPASERGVWQESSDEPPGGDVLVVGAYRDMRYWRSRYRHLVLVEHGIGQTYSNFHPAYPSGSRDPYSLLLAPGRHVVDLAARETVYVGSPSWSAPVSLRLEQPPTPAGRHAVSFHWDGSGISREAGTAFWQYLPHLEGIARQLGGLMVHAHPRIQWDVFEQLARWPSLTPVPSWDTVLEQADVYACDNSSTLYEFAATGRPVVVINAPEYRRGVEHGKRFWAWAGVGEQVSDPRDLAPAMLRALAEDPARAERERIVGLCYEGEPKNGVEALLRLSA